ncbi:hypothetical protein ACU686_03520 [Yinghuangia aomiensis]
MQPHDHRDGAAVRTVGDVHVDQQRAVAADPGDEAVVEPGAVGEPVGGGDDGHVL